MDKEQVTFDGIPIPLTVETILNAMEKAYPNSVPFFGAFADDPKRERQWHAFRDRIIRLDERSKMKTYTLEGKIAELEAEVDIRDKALDDSQVDLEMWRD